MPFIKGIIFDLDGTIIDSALDFNSMREEMGLPPGEPILEALARMSVDERSRCEVILDQHEQEGAEQAVLMSGAFDFIKRIHDLKLPIAIHTRNCRSAAEKALQKFDLHYDILVTREDAPAKPDPTAVIRIAERWEIKTEEIAFIGDFHFDLDTAINAHAHPVLYASNRSLADLPFHERAEFILTDFQQSDSFFEWITKSI